MLREYIIDGIKVVCLPSFAWQMRLMGSEVVDLELALAKILSQNI